MLVEIEKCKHTHIRKRKNNNSRCAATDGHTKRDREIDVRKPLSNRMTIHISIEMINVRMGVFGISGVDSETRSKRTNAFDSLMAIGHQNRLRAHIFVVVVM